MAQPVGTQGIIFRPNIWVAPLGTKLPKINAPFGANWADAAIGHVDWKKVNHTEEGAVIATSAPKDEVESDEAGGTFMLVPGGGAEITISFTPLTYDLDLFTWLASLQQQQNVSAVSNPDPLLAFPAYRRFSLTPEGKQFMFGIEGVYGEGSLTENGGYVRAFGYKVEQTNEAEVNFRRTGDDAVARIEAELRCLSTTVAPSQLTGTGITATDQRFDLFTIPTPTV